MNANVNEIEKIVVAIDDDTYKEAIKYSEFEWLKNAAERNGCKTPYSLQDLQVHRTEKTPDNTYHIFFWNFSDFLWGERAVSICPKPNEYQSLRIFLKNHRHAIVECTGDGLVFPDIKPDDQWGCDEEFEYILHWKTEVFLWNDEKNIIL